MMGKNYTISNPGIGTGKGLVNIGIDRNLSFCGAKEIQEISTKFPDIGVIAMLGSYTENHGNRTFVPDSDSEPVFIGSDTDCWSLYNEFGGNYGNTEGVHYWTGKKSPEEIEVFLEKRKRIYPPRIAMTKIGFH